MQFIEAAVNYSGLNLVLLPEVDTGAVETGLKYVNNDACYPTILVTGQLIEALQSGEYDTDNTTCIITQTGGGCRATNYVAFIRKALNEAGFAHVPCVPCLFRVLRNIPDWSSTRRPSTGPVRASFTEISSCGCSTKHDPTKR